MQRQELKLVARIVENLPVMTSDVMQGWVNNPKALKKFLSGLVPAATETFAPVLNNPDLLRWSNNYYKLFNQRPDLSQVRIPEKPEGVGPVRLIVPVHELLDWTKNQPMEGVQEALKKHFPGWEYDNDLDVAILTNDRDPRNGSYAVWVEDSQEPDDRYADKSADDLKVEGHVGPTILERQLHEFDYFVETGNHLDMKNITSCTGSRSSGGYVPYAYWGDRFSVFWCLASRRHSRLRSRRVWA